jgi:hypothetical protein
MDYDSNAPRTPPRTPPRNEGTNDPFTPVSVASSFVPTERDDMSPGTRQAITDQTIRHEESRLYKKVLITDMIILNHWGQVVENLYKLVPFTFEDRRKLRDGLWDDHIYNMRGENITAQHQVETSHNQDIAAIFNANAGSDSGSDQNARKRKKAGGKRTYKKNSKKNNSKNNKRNSKKNNSKK